MSELPQVLEYAENIINLIYPVGSIYMSTNNVSPQTFLGGTWEQIKDRFLLCSGDTYSSGSTGGEATHTLTQAEIPSHAHTRGSMEIYGEFFFEPNIATNINASEQNCVIGEGHGAFQTVYTNHPQVYIPHSYNGVATWSHDYGLTFTASRHWTGETSYIGSNQPHNNMPPYLAVYVWKRTS